MRKHLKYKFHAGEVEVAVALLFNYRKYAIVPNVSWGLGLNHECDMLLLDTKNRFTEVEIKVTASDLKRDFNKPHAHTSKTISRMFYAMPIELCEKYEHLIPKRYGIIFIRRIDVYGDGRFIKTQAGFYRQAKHEKGVAEPDARIIRKFLTLGCMRIWSLKQHNNKRWERLKQPSQ